MHGLPEQDDCWQAVLARDAAQDGAFYYAVNSTGVYCRPSCPSRRPKRENVRFFRAAEEAERAGFRPCQRCRPRAESDAQRRAALLKSICEYIEQNIDRPLTLAALGRHFGLSPFHLQRTFKTALGVTPREYADSCRLQSLKRRLQSGGRVTDALYDAGYGSSRGLYERSNAQLGMTPSAYRSGGDGVFIRYTTLESPVGRMLIAATEKGVCSIQFGSSEHDLLRELRREFPRSTLRRGEVVLRRWVRALLSQMYGKPGVADLPLDIQATAFQRRVWEHLRSIPYGKTESYAEVARSIGQPTATRAVARACGSNPVVVAIPCHRVVRGDGSLGGYRWGRQRKQRLLRMEKGARVARRTAGQMELHGSAGRTQDARG